jgi:hypothetical protein
MAKDPAFLFYPGDWQGGTSTLSRFLKGCYIDVLIAQFNSGHLSLEEIKTVLGSDFGQSWPTLQKKFNKDPEGLFYNVKLETEMIKRKEYSKSRSKNRTSKKDMNNICETYEKHMSLHMENENEDVNKNLVKNEKIKVRSNVLLKQSEILKLTEAHLPEEIEWMYDKLSAYKLSKGKKYKSDYGAILTWVVESLKKENPKQKTSWDERVEQNLKQKQYYEDLYGDELVSESRK